MISDAVVIGLLIISAFGLLVFGLLLLILSLTSRRGSYYERVEIEIPKEKVIPQRKSTLENQLSATLTILGIVLLITLLILLAYFTFGYISKGEFPLLKTVNTSANRTNATIISNLSTSSKPIKTNSSTGSNTSAPAISQSNTLKKLASDYGAYVILGLIILIVLGFALNRKEKLVTE